MITTAKTRVDGLVYTASYLLSVYMIMEQTVCGDELALSTAVKVYYLPPPPLPPPPQDNWNDFVFVDNIPAELRRPARRDLLFYCFI